MKKIFLLLIILPFVSLAQDETPTVKRDKIVITNLISQQLPELYRQNKFTEVINLMTEDFIMTNYVDGKEEIIMGKAELKRFYTERNYKDFNPTYTIKAFRILKNKAFMSGNYININDKVTKPVSFIMTLTKQPNKSWLISHVISASN